MGYHFPYWSGTYSLIQTSTVQRRNILFKETVPLYCFKNDSVNPLTLWVSPTEWYQPFRTFDGFDFGSVPLALQGLVSPLSAPKAFVLHDSNYEFHAAWSVNGLRELSRKEADNLLLIGMQAEGCNWWLRNKAWAGVRIGGSVVWTKGHDTLENARRDETAYGSPTGTTDERR